MEAQVVAAKASRSKLGARIVQVELSTQENVSVTLILRRGGKTLLKTRFARVRTGNPVLTLVVPKAVGKGRATLTIELSDADGNKKVTRRTVTIPKATK